MYNTLCRILQSKNKIKNAELKLVLQNIHYRNLSEISKHTGVKFLLEIKTELLHSYLSASSLVDYTPFVSLTAFLPFPVFPLTLFIFLPILIRIPVLSHIYHLRT